MNKFFALTVFTRVAESGGFTPAARMQLMQAFKGLETDDCPFINPPEKKSGRWGQDLNKERMKDCIWLGSKVKGQRELLSVP